MLWSDNVKDEEGYRAVCTESIPLRRRPKGWNSIEDPVVSLERNFFGHPLASLLWERYFEEVTVEKEWERVPTWERSNVQKKLGLFLSVSVDDITMVGKKQNIDCMWKTLQKEIYLEDPTPSLDQVSLGCTQREAKCDPQAAHPKPSCSRN